MEEKIRHRMLVAAYKISRNWADAEDAVQDACIRLLDAKGVHNFESYAVRAAYNTAINNSRKKKHNTLNWDLSYTVDEDFDVDYDEDYDGEITKINSIVEQLTPKLRDTMKLFIKDHSYIEIADILDCPLGTVKSRLHKARLELKEMILRCELCGNLATHQDSIPDANVEGYSGSECGYRIIYLCTAHAYDRGNTSRVRKIDD